MKIAMAVITIVSQKGMSRRNESESAMKDVKELKLIDKRDVCDCVCACACVCVCIFTCVYFPRALKKPCHSERSLDHALSFLLQ